VSPLRVAYVVHQRLAGVLGPSEYGDRFEENRIDLEILPDLTDQDLEKLDVFLGDRRKILRAIRQRSAAATSPEPRVREDPRLDEAAERRQLSVMFIDLVGSTELSARLDPEDFAEVIGSYHRICASAVTKFGGSVAKYVGDGVLAYFGYPEAHGEDAELKQNPRESRIPQHRSVSSTR
jgi:class 3 adenylate cyclase